MEWKQLHPLYQITDVSTHKLLLKQWLEEEELILNRIVLRETQIDSVRKEITLLYIFFFLFHSISLMLLFNSLSSRSHTSEACCRSWVPLLYSLIFFLGVIWAIRFKNKVKAHTKKLLEREKEDLGLLTKCIEELKKKGLEFDLLKEVYALRRAKSLRFENKEVPKWFARDFVSLFLFSVSCLSLAVTRVILCS